MSRSRASAGRGGSSKAAVTSQLPAAIEGDIDKLRRYHAELGELIQRLDTEHSPVDRISRHVRRHLPLYALGTVWALMIVLIPTVNQRGTTTSAGALTGATAGETTGSTEGTTGTTGAGTTGIGGGVSPRSAGVAGPVVTSGPVGKVAVGTGVTRGGYECKPGVRQLPWSTYANPCSAKFNGSNGGKTYRGVDQKTIRIAVRQTAVNAGNVTDAQDLAAGRTNRAGAFELLKKYSAYFEKTMELYGRKIEFVRFDSNTSNGIDEAQSRGAEGACADATDIAESVKAFAVLGYATTYGETQPFAQCAAERKLFVPFGAAYFPESWYRDKWDPYVWHIYMQCEQITQDLAEYVGKRLLNRNAKWAKDAVYQKQQRKFGVYVPDNDGYQRCVNLFEKTFKQKYGGTVTHRINYQLDATRFPDQAAQAVVAFKAQGITTLVNACDNLSTRFLTEAAQRQEWGPEWVIIGVDRQDTDGTARSFNQEVVNGHLFGLSQLGQSRLIEGKDGEAYKTWKTAFPNDATPQGYGEQYYRVLALFMMLQAAGPILTPANIAAGLRSMPDGGGAHGAFGTWSFKGDHTAIDDSREIYWVGSAKGFDGGNGAYIETYGGRRFRSGQWSREEPPIYRKK